MPAKMKNDRGRWAIGASLLALSIATPALAQDADDVAQGPAENVAQRDIQDARGRTGDEERRIVVTGSRVPRSTFETPNPVTIVTAEDLEKSSPSTLAAALNNLPALVSEGGPNATSGQRTAGRNTLDLRGIGSNRTLTLVNGQRWTGSSPAGNLDTNVIPQGLVSRVEVVTGGASAAYGSDAVAGVVNFILDTRYEGLKLSGGAGIAEEGDGFEYRGSLTWGTELAAGLNVVLAGEYYNAEGIDGDARDHRVQGANLIPNPLADGTAANPDLIIADMARLGDATVGGFISSARAGRRSANSSLVGQQFLPGGALGPFDMGINNTGSLQDGGDGINTAIYQPITRPLERAVFFAGIDADLSENVRLYMNGGYGYTRSSNAATAFHTGRFGITIASGNPFLPANVQQQMDDEGLTSIRIERYDTEYDMEVVAENHNRRVQLGLEFDLGGDWLLDVSGQVGANTETALNYNNFIPDLYAQGVDAVVENGQIVCADQSNGCVPINPFGFGSYTQEMIDFFTGTSFLETRVAQEILQLTLTGDLFDGIGAGAWGIAAGGVYRRDFAEVDVDPLSEANGYFTNNFQPWEAEREVKEGFTEINMPLVADTPGFDWLELNGAVRFTDYEFSGGVTTWKVGLNYAPVPDVRFRGSISRDIRAPGLGEMFTRGRSTSRNRYFDPVLMETVAPLTQQQGNPFLVPEIADTIVFGVVIEPSFMPGLSFSVDRFDIQMENALNTLSGQDIIDQCHIEGFAQACQQIIRDTDNRIIQINNSNFNLDDLSLVGWDFEARYRTDLGLGQLTFRVQASLLEELVEQDFQNNTIDRVGETTTPEWRALASLNYDIGQFNAFLQGRYIGENVLNVRWGPGDSEYNEVPAALYLDAQFGYDVTDNVSVSLNIQNLLDKDPVFAPQQDTYYSPTNPNVYDQIGRAYRLRVRAEF